MTLSQEVNVVVYVIVSQSSKTLTTTKLNCPYISAQTLKCVTALKLSAAASQYFSLLGDELQFHILTCSNQLLNHSAFSLNIQRSHFIATAASLQSVLWFP